MTTREASDSANNKPGSTKDKLGSTDNKPASIDNKLGCTRKCRQQALERRTQAWEH